MIFKSVICIYVCIWPHDHYAVVRHVGQSMMTVKHNFHIDTLNIAAGVYMLCSRIWTPTRIHSFAGGLGFVSWCRYRPEFECEYVVLVPTPSNLNRCVHGLKLCVKFYIKLPCMKGEVALIHSDLGSSNWFRDHLNWNLMISWENSMCDIFQQNDRTVLSHG